MQGNALWTTTQIQDRFVPEKTKFSVETLTWLVHTMSDESKANKSISCKENDRFGKTVQLVYLGKTSKNHFLIRVVDDQEDSTQSIIKSHLDLTEREADVLSWLVNGKTNKEIAQILEISSRTVNKHLDNVYIKLGVENRTAAAMATMRRIAEHLPRSNSRY